MKLNSNDIICATLNIMTVIKGKRVLYYSSEKDDMLYASLDINRVLLYCNMGITYENLILKINRLENISVINARKLVDDLVSVGLLYTKRLFGKEYSGEPETRFYKKEISKTVVPIPNSVSIHLGYDCNLSCSYCYNKIIRLEDRINTELNPRKWRQILNSLDRYGVKKIVLTGGEPLLFKNMFIDVFSGWKDNGKSIALLTNGTRINENDIPLLVKLFDSISISIDSHKEEIVDKLRGAGVFSAIHNTISLFNKHKIKWSINSVLTTINIDDYDITKIYYKSKGAVNVKPTIVDATSLNDFVLLPSLVQIENFYLKNYELKRDLITFGKLKNLIHLDYGCGAGINEFAIAPDGKIYPCRLLMSKEWCCGDLMTHEFKEVWENSQVLKRLREYSTNIIDSACPNCKVRKYCKGGCIAHSKSTPSNIVSSEGGFYCHLTKFEIPLDIELNCYMSEVSSKIGRNRSSQ